MSFMFHSVWPETSDGAHEVIREVFSEITEQAGCRLFSDRLAHNQKSFCSQRSHLLPAVKKNTGLRHLGVGFSTFSMVRNK